MVREGICFNWSRRNALETIFQQGWEWNKVRGGGGGDASGLLSRSLRYVRKTFLKVECARKRKGVN